ncbi:hypothetical protein QM012_006755 [Aureobasidium pullulans]|uniref:Uncharacterized protein n=1 Tax=Aureobasidium pullulans TaxID=5580 RepID=A0ABR0TPI5_AURPU
MAQMIPVPPAHAFSHHAVSSSTPEDFLIDIVEGSDSDYDAQMHGQMNTRNRRKQSASILTTFHCWKLTKATPKTKDGAPSWKRAELVRMTLPSDELESQVKKQRKAKSLTEMYEALSADQRQQVEVLIQQQRRDETKKYARWEIAAIHRELLNNLRTRIRETTFIRIILCRDDRRKVENTTTDHETFGTGVISNISDLNDLSDSLLKQTETIISQRLPLPKAQTRVKKAVREDVINIIPVSSIDNTHVNVPSMASPPRSARLQSPDTTWGNQAPLWQSPTINIEQDNMLRNQPNHRRPQQGFEVQNNQQLDHVQNALAYMAHINTTTCTQTGGKIYEDQSALLGPWSPRQSQHVVSTFEYNPHAMPTGPNGESVPQVISPHLGPQPSNGKQDYFEQHFTAPLGKVAEPSIARQYHKTNNDKPPLVASHNAMDSELHRTSPNTKIQVSTNEDWPDYNPVLESSTPILPQPQQQNREENHTAERLRREDVLFWRTQAQLSHSRSSSSIGDHSSTLASPEQSSPPTSVSGDGIAPQFQYHERDAHAPVRFGQQLAAHDFLRPKQDGQREQPLKLPQRDQYDHKPPTRRVVSFEDESFEPFDRQPAPRSVPNAHKPSMYSSDNCTRPSAPDPPEPKADYSTYRTQRYQPQQPLELENISILERLNERLDHLELRQAEGATRKAVEAAQKRRELEKKEAYERGVEDAMAWKARSGGFGSFG